MNIIFVHSLMNILFIHSPRKGKIMHMSLPPELFQAAQEEFSRKGYKATSIAAIAKRAGIAVGSVYLHCPSKYELFHEVYTEVNHQKRQQIITAIDWSEPKQAFSQFLTEIMALLKQDRILSEWLSTDPGDKLRNEPLCQLYNSFYIDKLAQWRAEGLVNQTITDDTLFELFDALRILDQQQALSPEALQVLTHALLNEIFLDQ